LKTMAPPIKPPPDTWEGTNTMWKSLTPRQRKDAKTKVAVFKRRKIRPPPDSYIGSKTEWESLNKNQRSAIKRKKVGPQGPGRNPIHPPPDGYIGSATEWISLTSYQRKNVKQNIPPVGCTMSLADWRMLSKSKRAVIRKKNSRTPTRRKFRIPKPIKPPPQHYLGTLVEWKLLTYEQRYRILNREHIAITTAIKRQLPQIKLLRCGYAKKARDIIRANDILKAASKAKIQAYNLKNKTKISESRKAFRTVHSVRITAQDRKRYSDNKSGRKDKLRAYFQTDRSKACKRKWRVDNAVHIKLYNRAYYCRKASEWWKAYGTKEAVDAVDAGRAALASEQNRDKPWASTYARDRAMEASFEAVDTV
jgi:hypothetical protein